MKKLFFYLIMVIAVVLVGCSKTGEKESTEYIKKRLNVPNSFVKVGYDINKETRLAWLDYKAKNKLGVELTGRAYFRISDKGVNFIDTEDVEQPVLDFLINNHSVDLEEQVNNYKRFVEIVKNNSFEIKYFLEKMDDVDITNYYSVSSLNNRARDYNRALRKVRESYNRLPVDLKDFLEKEYPSFKTFKEIKYFNTGLKGNSFKWDIDFDKFGFTKDYPD